MTIDVYNSAVVPFVNGQPVSVSNPLPTSGGSGTSGQAFSPAGSTANIAATTTSARVAIPAGTQILVTNAPGGSLAFISFGDGTVVATAAASMPVIPGAAYTLTPPSGTTNMAAITATGSTTVYVTGGAGN